MVVIIHRELLDLLRSLHFVLLLIISTGLFVADGFIFAGRYSANLSRYSRQITENDSHPSTINTKVIFRPAEFAFLAEAGESRSPLSFTLGPGDIPTPDLTEKGNRELAIVPDIDWAFIVKIIFSLYAILLSFDAISGEREEGTLRQVLSNPVARIRIMAGKYVAIIGALLIPLIIGIILSLLILSQFDQVVMSPDSLGRVVLFVVLSGIYLSVFAFLGLAASSLFRSSAFVLLIALAVWVLLVIIIPNASGIISDSLRAVPGEYEVAKQYKEAFDVTFQTGFDALQQSIDKGEITDESQAQVKFDRLAGSAREAMIKARESYVATVKGRSAVARSLSRVSPTALFQYTAEGIAGTGILREARQVEDLKNYADLYNAFVLKKVGKLTSTANAGFGAYLAIRGKLFSLRSSSPEDYRGDMSDFPRFAEHKYFSLDGVRDALEEIVPLVFWNLGMLLFAGWSIQRCDIR